jgi:hypothetical protein
LTAAVCCQALPSLPLLPLLHMNALLLYLLPHQAPSSQRLHLRGLVALLS